MLEKQRKAYLSVNYMDIYSGTYLDWHLHEHLLCTTGENSPRCMNLDISCLSITGGLSLKKKHIHSLFYYMQFQPKDNVNKQSMGECTN